MDERRRALITGIAGQDGTYLAEYLSAQGVDVFGIHLPDSESHTYSTKYRELSICSRENFSDYIREIQPHECYHLAAHHSSSSAGEDDENDFDKSIQTNFISTQTLLSAVRTSIPECRVFLAGSCHMFGNPAESPQTEETSFSPVNMYGISKVSSMHLGRMYREKYGIFVCTGILYNHESPLRGLNFITSRIAKGVTEVLAGKIDTLVVGNLDAKVDWGFAGDYVHAMYKMLQAEKPEDYIIASGETHTVRDFARVAFEHVGLDWTRHVYEDPDIYRPVSKAVFCGDSRKIRENLGWKPEVSFESLVQMMVDAHLKREKN
ncbi:MAG: GDP-mannose 4,6-dehydratase [bacterium]|nr:GDP-mannose 4,6-dehydratase [bacterium]